MLLLSLLFVAVVARNSAVLVSSSIGYYNYRQAANLLAVYKHLRLLGWSENDIALMMPENAGCCQKNPLPGSVSLVDDDYTNLNTELQLDHRFSTFHLQTLYDVLRGRSHPFELNKKRLRFDKHTNLLVYVTGHG